MIIVMLPPILLLTLRYYRSVLYTIIPILLYCSSNNMSTVPPFGVYLPNLCNLCQDNSKMTII